jgi:hypothetical protein
VEDGNIVMKKTLNEKIVKIFCISQGLNTEDENTILITSSGQKMILNKTGTQIWNLIDDNRSCQDIIDIMINNYSNEECRPDEATTYIVDFIQELRALGLIAFSGKMGLWEVDE